MSALYVLENAWYLPAANTWKEFQTLAMKDIGILTVDTKGIFYRGGDYSLVIDRLSWISLKSWGL